MKWGAFNGCAKCRSKPRTDDELAASLAFTDHYFGEDALEQIGRSIRNGNPPQLTDALRVKLAPAVREAKTILPLDRSAREPLGNRQKRFTRVLIILLMNAVAVIVVGSVLDSIPSTIRRPLGYIAVPVGFLWLLWLWSTWRAKERGSK